MKSRESNASLSSEWPLFYEAGGASKLNEHRNSLQHEEAGKALVVVHSAQDEMGWDTPRARPGRASRLDEDGR